MDLSATEKNGAYDGPRSCIAPTQFVKSSNLTQVVDVADKDGLPSVGPNRLMRI